MFTARTRVSVRHARRARQLARGVALEPEGDLVQADVRDPGSAASTSSAASVISGGLIMRKCRNGFLAIGVLEQGHG
ncbi:hypothetical protein IU470_09290 [Nocardia abscessus]|uniref:Uncharacterized protein n=1 Tax=Nocardia abscessus TaxID=120957 RepID=A0ABS0C725_9NOCA|nr:hypothetical protein [Nocardia abscessus]MBF6225303.1 hypothetical protein [Nocardia abscessus]